MKTAEEILELHFGSEYYKLRELGYLNHITGAMKEYANEKLDQAAENADTHEIENVEWDGYLTSTTCHCIKTNMVVNKQSILSLKDEIQ